MLTPIDTNNAKFISESKNYYMFYTSFCFMLWSLDELDHSPKTKTRTSKTKAVVDVFRFMAELELNRALLSWVKRKG